MEGSFAAWVRNGSIKFVFGEKPVLVCLGSFVVLCVLVLIWSLMKHPETERIVDQFEPLGEGQVQ